MTAPLSYSMKGAVAATGLSASTLDRAIRSGKLRAKSSNADADGNPNGARVILATDLQAYLDGLVDA